MFAQLKKDVTLPAGFSMRPAEMDGAAAVADLLNASQEALTGLRPTTAQQIRAEWQNPAFDLAHSTRVVIAPNGRLVGYIAVWDTDPVPAGIWVSARVHPQFEGLGLGTTLHTWGEARAREALERVPEGIKVVVDSGVLDIHETAIELLESMGMQRVRYFFRMAIDLTAVPPEPRLPEGIVIRPWSEVQDRISLRDIAQADDEAFRDHWGYVEQPFDEMMKQWQHWVETDTRITPELWFLALDGNEIAGVSLCLDKSQGRDDWGYVESVGVRRPWRRQGLALALLHHTFRAYYRRGYQRAELHVDASSLTGATRLYEKAGMHVDEQSLAYQKVLRDGRDISTQALT